MLEADTMQYWHQLQKFIQDPKELTWKDHLILPGALAQACRAAVLHEAASDENVAVLLQQVHQTLLASKARVEEFLQYFYTKEPAYAEYAATGWKFAEKRMPESLDIAILGTRLALAAQQNDVAQLAVLASEAGGGTTQNWARYGLSVVQIIEQVLPRPSDAIEDPVRVGRVRQAAYHALGVLREAQMEVELPLLYFKLTRGQGTKASDPEATGSVYRLHLTRLTSGHGVCFDDPMKMGLVPIGGDFVESVETAWQIARHLCRTGDNVDICWWVSEIEELKPGLLRPLHGNSAGALFSIALTQLRRGILMDDDWTATAAVDRHGQLQPVHGVSAKVYEVLSLAGAGGKPRVNRVIVHPTDVHEARKANPFRIGGGGPAAEIISATTVEETLPQVRGLADDIRRFLDNVRNNGLAFGVRELPEHLNKQDIEKYCLPARVIDIDKLKESAQQRTGHASRKRDADSGYQMPADEQIIRDEIKLDMTEPLRVPRGRTVLIGEPGGGKSTALWLAVAQQCNDPAWGLPEYRVPLVLPLKDADTGKIAPSLTTQALEFVLGLNTGGSGKLRTWLEQKISRGQYTLYLDALDELPGAGPARKWLQRQLDQLPGDQFPGEVPLLITTRKSDSDQITLRRPRRFTLSPFSPRQIRQFVELYFAEQPHRAEELLDWHRRSSGGPRQFLQLPLLLALLCKLKERHPGDLLPRTRTELLGRALDGMLERGDEKQRERPSSRGRRQQKERVLRHIAWRFHALEPLPMPTDDLLKCLRKHLELIEKDPPADAEALFDELLQDGVLVRTGLERYAFVLRSFHEYCLAGWIAQESPFCEDREQFQRVVSGDANAWERTDWGDLKPLDEENWKHIWPLVSGLMKERAGWLIDAVLIESTDKDDCSRLPTNLGMLQLGAVIVAECGRDLLEGKRFRDSLILRLNNPDSPDGVRYWCARTLGEIGDERSREALIALLDNPEVPKDVREGCAGGLGIIGDEPSREALIACLDNPGEVPENVRAYCAQELGKIGDERSREALLKSLDNSDVLEGVRSWCALALGEIGDESSREALLDRLDNPELAGYVRRACALTLMKIGGERMREALLARLDNPKVSDYMRGWCAFALGAIGAESSREALLARLDNPELPYDVRASCASAFGKIRGERSCEALLARLNNPREPDDVRALCAQALGNIGNERSLSALNRHLNSPREPDDVRAWCAQALGNIGNEPALRALLDCLNNRKVPDDVLIVCALAVREIVDESSREALLDRRDNPYVRGGYSWVTGEIGDKSSREALLARLDNPEVPYDVRASCAWALGKIGDQRSRGALINRLDNPELLYNVRALCAWALGQIDDERSREALLNRRDNPEVPNDVRGWCAEALGRTYRR